MIMHARIELQQKPAGLVGLKEWISKQRCDIVGVIIVLMSFAFSSLHLSARQSNPEAKSVKWKQRIEKENEHLLSSSVIAVNINYFYLVLSFAE